MHSKVTRPETTTAEADEPLRHVGEAIRDLVNPVDYFSGARSSEALMAENVVVFKRTSAEMLKPRGVTHNYHHRFKLIVPLRRDGRVHIDGNAYQLCPGQAILLFPHQFHHYLDIKGGEINWLFITFEFNQPQALATLRNSPRVVTTESAEFLGLLMQTYAKQAPGAQRNFDLIVGVSQLLHRLLSAREADCAVRADDAATNPRGKLLQDINAYVRANLNKPLTIAKLSKHTGYSISHLRAVFREAFGASLGAYMRDSRLAAAAALLVADNGRSVDSVAKACGFVSIFAFSRAFKNAMGVPPSAYHKLLRNGRGGQQRRVR